MEGNGNGPRVAGSPRTRQGSWGRLRQREERPCRSLPRGTMGRTACLGRQPDDSLA
jgi:hypothetical protein